MDSISTALIAKALDGLTARFQATAQNIANANSPNYRPIRVTFEDSLRSAAMQGGRAIAGVEPRVELAPMPRIASEMRLDLEIATASQTAMRYGAILSILGRQMDLSRTIVSGGR
ncbi:flagellar basal body rod protein FlgB [Sphingomonas sp. CJ20]